ncbi:phosphoribosylformimino-5-aminoimidazole carboxamide ribotide isomerase [Roseburia sp. MUC/MUC-530-WT-4D]|uniref:Phosphoribosylformimino-5-aminoimidazole carboxamide ribotide isomerase n=1 Tax=Roseburia porci TaxID=2605790 RepID=A0A6L5YRG6_9FIRM|nr:phosphoribosylformimino-5-aminoimidazole carboxamide ribotide isomerase [Roseburia porci]MCI5516002.1 phosphoribosylformimino-5-aminoimidazole carboxamide ribotide isomerase [Roseburia sp.]MST74311.1 phosphoribosylformimino-5-aminoimidazole carboxamide ribotide isomerase [Roseburia porci]
MQFRPCIDIHNGKVKQIVGSSLRDAGDQAEENFVAEQNGAFFAKLYKDAGIRGGHIILLNPEQSEYYEATRAQALLALHEYPGGLQIGGGIHAGNAASFIKEGASHVIVTSYVFKDGKISFENLKRLVNAVGKEHLVLDLSCRFRGDGYYIVTDRWQKFTEEKVTTELLDRLAEYCDEFLVHAVDVEGKASGIEEELAGQLGRWNRIPVTYAGGVRNFDDLRKIRELGHGHLNVTIGSALDLFGGTMSYQKVLDYIASVQEA